jgi:RHS repeat-associated protein
MAETDATGALVWKESYRPYGDPVQPPSGDNKLWYTGKPYDKDNGLTYMGARYYDPLVGRFTGMDSVGFDEDNIHSFGRYTYANNNPNKFVDPDGRMSTFLFLRRDMTMNEAIQAGAPFRATAPIVAAAAGAVGVAGMAPGIAVAAATAPAAVAVAGKTVAKHAGDAAEIAGLVSTLAGNPSPHPDLPANSPIEPKTSVQQVTKAANSPKIPSGGIFSKVLSVLAPIVMFASEQPKPVTPPTP